jgi:hypothetical protein
MQPMMKLTTFKHKISSNVQIILSLRSYPVSDSDTVSDQAKKFRIQPDLDPHY